MNDRFAGLLGLAKRAGKVAVGFDETVSQVKKRKAFLVLLATDLSPKSEKEWRYATKDDPIPIRRCPLSKAELAHALGLSRQTGLAAVTDEGFAKALAAHCSEDKED
ncbi:MAG: ribosomal L7Ae/L30e/S12e/Gadd45 family protein [Clostridia bacterium]|nr:ribosomal L7Ae/L30e/S12e/Gadd45 family protein [Clostridia bacterium]MBQ2939021.1 ribosomal L7Ae/L30e/S12e/Gadd45 family protein [Clostridia bacterium]